MDSFYLEEIDGLNMSDCIYLRKANNSMNAFFVESSSIKNWVNMFETRTTKFIIYFNFAGLIPHFQKSHCYSK